MKNLLFYALLAAVAMTVIASACTTSRNKADETVWRYVGTLPAADCPGILYDLTLCGLSADSMAGTFALSTTYLEAENGKDVRFDSEGRWEMLQGIPGDSTALFYRLVETGKGFDTTNFLYLGDSVMLLGAGLQRPQSALNYTLIRVAE
jgi:hypothetical protein